jgi:hypothetical protein
MTAMPPLLLLVLQIAASFVAFGLLAGWIAAPRLRTLSRERALAPLLWVHVFRYLPLALLAPGQAGPDVSAAVAGTIAWGDLVASALALVALVALRASGGAGLRWVWLFTVASTADIVVALALGLGSGIYRHPLGFGWYVLVLYVPLVCVAQAMIIAVLLRPSREESARRQTR